MKTIYKPNLKSVLKEAIKKAIITKQRDQIIFDENKI